MTHFTLIWTIKFFQSKIYFEGYDKCCNFFTEQIPWELESRALSPHQTAATSSWNSQTIWRIGKSIDRGRCEVFILTKGGNSKIFQLQEYLELRIKQIVPELKSFNIEGIHKWRHPSRGDVVTFVTLWMKLWVKNPFCMTEGRRGVKKYPNMRELHYWCLFSRI